MVSAVAGGLAQNVSFVIGLKALLLLAAGFYVLAAICGREGEELVLRRYLSPAEPGPAA
jgi:hypothetical protein